MAVETLTAETEAKHADTQTDLDELWTELAEQMDPAVESPEADKWAEVAARVRTENPQERLEGLRFSGPGE